MARRPTVRIHPPLLKSAADLMISGASPRFLAVSGVEPITRRSLVRIVSHRQVPVTTSNHCASKPSASFELTARSHAQASHHRNQWLEAVALALQPLATRFTVSNRVVSGLRDVCGQRLQLASPISVRCVRTPALPAQRTAGLGARRCKCQWITQRIPESTVSPPGEPRAGGVMPFPVLNGSQHNYRRAAA